MNASLKPWLCRVASCQAADHDALRSGKLRRSFGNLLLYQGSGMGASRSAGSSGDRSSSERSSSVRAAINDGQWHSFGNAGGSAHSSAGRNSGGPANNSSLSAHNAGSADGRWHSFGPSSGASQRGRVVSDFVPLRGSFGRGGDVWRGGWRGHGWERGWSWGGWGL